MGATTRYRICPFCEATCGLKLEVDGREILDVRGDDEDGFSEGYICPKGVAIKDLDGDPDRLRRPMIREENEWREASWDEALAYIDEKLTAIITEHGKNSVGIYLGNPTVHNTGLGLYSQAFIRTLGTKNVFTATTVDQMPKQLASALMFGTGLSLAIPDIDRCDYLLIIGANPVESNGSLMTAPNIAERLKRLRRRGGKIVVIDPRRTKTAKEADEHFFIQPGTDAFFLFAIVHTLFEENLVSVGRLEEHTSGLDEVRRLAQTFSPEAVEERCGIAATEIRRMAREVAGAKSASVYARIGASTQEFGTLSNWLPDVIHILTGNLDREGGAMFALPVHGSGNSKGKPGIGKGLKTGRRTTRVRGLSEIFGEFPVACLSEEIETPGKDQIRAMFTVAGNPVLSTPNGTRLSKALASLDFMVSLDIYLNETTRHADVILPGLSPLETCHYDFAFLQLAVHTYARYSAPIFDTPEGQVPEWETVLRLVGIVSGLGPKADVATLDGMVAMNVIQREISLETSPIHDREPEDILKALEPRRGPERIVDFMIRTGPHGEAFGANPEGLTLERLEDNPHGIDLGPNQARIPEVLRTATGKIEAAPELIVADVSRLEASLGKDKPPWVLIGRRDIRSNNSWMHNLEKLVAGKPRCTLHIHPEDAASLDLDDGGMAEVTSRVGSVKVPVECTGEIMRGVVSIPHGWGHDAPGIRMKVAAAHSGVNSNILTDEEVLDAPSGNAVLCGIPVTIAAAPHDADAEKGTLAAVK